MEDHLELIRLLGSKRFKLFTEKNVLFSDVAENQSALCLVFRVGVNSLHDLPSWSDTRAANNLKSDEYERSLGELYTNESGLLKFIGLVWVFRDWAFHC